MTRKPTAAVNLPRIPPGRHLVLPALIRPPFRDIDAFDFDMDSKAVPRLAPDTATTANAAASLAVATTGSASGNNTSAGAKNTGIQLSNKVAPGASNFLWSFSPIDPVGFVGECQRLGLLAIPSAFTSNECWALHRRGVRLIKLFHAGLASPAILKSMLAVTPLGEHLERLRPLRVRLGCVVCLPR